jgi:hypothetical protein
MQLVTLTQVKFQLRITHAVLDAGLTDLTDRVEREVLQYVGFLNRDAFLDHFAGATDTDTEIAEQSLAVLQSAVLGIVGLRFEDTTSTGIPEAFKRLLLPYRPPAFSSGTTE